MPAAQVNDINIYYETYGEGEPLLLVIGLGGDLTRWFRNVPIFSREYRVIAFDNRGAGRTDKPDMTYTMEMMADDAVGLLDALGIEAAHVFGISLGGMIAQHFGLRHPGRAASLTLGCTWCGGPHGVAEDTGASSAFNPELISALSAEERSRNMLPYLWSREFIENNPDIVEESIRINTQYPVEPVGYTHQLEAAKSHDTYDRLPDITVPTLVIHGEEDRLIPAENARILASRIPGAELVILEKLGHAFYSEANEEVSRILMDFMKRHSRS